MKSFIIALVACSSLSGCFQQTSNYDIHRAVTFCGTVENVAFIVVRSGGGESVQCMDQTGSELSDVKVKNK